MIVDVLSTLNKAQPWWLPLRPYLPGARYWEARLCAHPQSGTFSAGTPAAQCVPADPNLSVAGLLNALAPPACPVRFTSQSSLPTGMAYEQFIHETGLCPTRDNLHDFFNGLCWFRFPKVKTLLNRIQAQQIRRQGVGQHRGVIRDTITLLDEGGLFLLAPQPLWEAILQRDWQRAFIGERQLWSQAQTAVFGHALLEKCVNPYKAITANVIRVPAGTDIKDIDRVMSRELEGILSDGRLQAKPLCPLPVMGIPGWDAASEDPAFYSDLQVFRPPRR